jgi:spore germination protein KB
MEKVRISNIQLALLTFAFLYGNTPIANNALGAKNDAWLAVLLSLCVGTIIITMQLYVSKINKGKNLVEILQSCFGKVFGKIIGLLYVFHFLHIAALNTRGFGEFMKIVNYPHVPIYILMGVLVLLVTYIVKGGLEVAGRLSEIFVPLIPITIVLVAFSITRMQDFSGFEPVLIKIPAVIKAAAGSVSIVFGDFIVFLMILPYTNNEKGRFKAIYIVLAVLGLSFLIITVRDTLLIGPELFDAFPYPSHIAAQMLPMLSIDPLVDIALLLGGGLKIVIHLYVAVKMTAEIFSIEDYKPIVSAFSVFVFVCAYWVFKNATEGAKWLESISVMVYVFPFQTLIPVIMLVISIINKNKKLPVESQQ